MNGRIPISDRFGGWPVIACASSVLIFLILASHAAWIETPTVDEYAHVPAGCAVWKWGRTDIYAKNPPLYRLLMTAPVCLAGADIPEVDAAAAGGWGPWNYGFSFQLDNRQSYLKLFFLARLVTVLVTAAIGVRFFVWVRGLLCGPSAAMGTALFLLSPDVLAHGHLATLDIACLGSMLLVVIALQRALVQPSWQRNLSLGLLLGLAIGTKFTAVLLVPGIVLALLWQFRRRSWAPLLTVAVASWGVLLSAYGGRDVGLRIDEIDWQSQTGQQVAACLPGWLPLPFPGDLVRGFDAQKHDTEVTEFPAFLLESWSDGGWWSYNFIALIVKLEVVVWVCVICGLAALWKERVRGSLAIWLAPATVFVFLTLFNRLNIGVRYLLPLYPYLFLAAAAAWRWPWGLLRWRAAALVFVLILIPPVWVHPNYLSWFNLLAGGPRQGHHVLIDSNLDWGQDLYRVPGEIQRRRHAGPVGLLYFGHVHPMAYGIDFRLVPREPVSGLLFVSVNFIQGAEYMATAPNGDLMPVHRGDLDWLKSYEPVARLGTIWVYDTR